MVELRGEPGTGTQELRSFSLFVQQNSVLLKTLDSFDVAAASFVEQMWEEGETKTYCQDLLASLQYYIPSLRRNLALSWRLLAAWGRHDMPTRVMPMTPEILAAFCGGLVAAGHPSLALLCVFGFSSLAQTGELLSLERRHVVVGKTSAVVAFEWTKRGQRVGVDEGLTIEDPVTRTFARTWRQATVSASTESEVCVPFGRMSLAVLRSMAWPAVPTASGQGGPRICTVSPPISTLSRRWGGGSRSRHRDGTSQTRRPP